MRTSARTARLSLVLAAGIAVTMPPPSPTELSADVVVAGAGVGGSATRPTTVRAAFTALHRAPDVRRVTSMTSRAPVVTAICDGLDALPLGLCTHGPDDAPAAAATSNAPGASVKRRALTCHGSGADGQRVEVLYVRGPGRPAASSTRVASIRGWVEQVEWTVGASAERFGGERQVRWRTDTSCAAVVTSVGVSSSSLASFDTMVDELADRGYDRRDRTYMLFVESTTYCGIATAPRDDGRTDNLSTRSTGYARVDTPCWDAGDEGYHSIAAHELLHTLGAVQRSAPHATTRGHCTDEHDLLCYDDGSGASMQTVCRDGDSSTSGAGDANDRLLDCRGDNYFNPSPSGGSYLATHWNTADHPRLHNPRAKPKPKPKPTPTGDPVGYLFGLLP